MLRHVFSLLPFTFLVLLAGCESSDPDCEAESVGFPTSDGAVRVPLNLLCDAECAADRRDFFEGLTCEEVDDAQSDWIDSSESDSGANQYTTRRSEGCGSVQYTSHPDAWPRYFNFDASTGELIGALRVDDVGAPLAGSSCDAAAWIAGTVRLSSCEDEVISLCH